MSIGQVFSRGLDGLSVSQRGLSTVANNIANINTPGYARQQIIIGPRADVGGGGGAEVLRLYSVVNPFIELQLFSTANDFGTVDGRRRTLEQVEAIHNVMEGGGLSDSLNDFFDSWSTLGTDASSITFREAVKERGVLLADKFRAMNRQLNSMRTDLSSEIETRVETINDIAASIAELNERIAGAPDPDAVVDLVSSRRHLLRQLSEEVNISYYETSNGAIQVAVAGGTSLVSNFSSNELSMTDNQADNGDVAILIDIPGTDQTIDITNKVTSGRLGGNLIDRNTTLNDQIDDLDDLAYQFATQFNARHDNGYGLNGATGINFFAPLASAAGAAASIQVNSTILNDVENIAAASADPAVSGVGDNGNIIGTTGLLALQTDATTMSGGTQSFLQFYQSVVTDIGSTVSAVNRSYDTNATLLNQMELQRESVSGVNLDEEGTDLIRFQRAFQASSKLMQIADNLLGTLLEIGR